MNTIRESALEFEMLQAKARLAAIDRALREGIVFFIPMLGYRVFGWRVPTIEEAADILVANQPEER
jgi:hypothetical protein